MRWCATLLSLALLAIAAPARAAGPDPAVAVLLSAASTVGPPTITIGLWGTGRGVTEGVRFDVGMGALAVGAILGPSVGQLYAGGGTNALVSLILRALTGSVMLTGVGFWVRGTEDEAGLGQALTFLGGVPTALLAVYDIVDASSSALETKRKKATADADPLPVIDIGGFALCSSVAGSCPGSGLAVRW